MNAASVNSVTAVSETVKHDLDRLRETVGRVVGSVFFGKLLETMRDSKLKGDYGHGGRGEEVFAAQLHGILAERAGASMQAGVDDALMQHLGRQQRLISTQRANAKEVAV